MVNVAGVRFRTAGKVYYFDPGEFNLFIGTNVIVETTRGIEYGTVSGAVRPVSEDRIVQPLKKIIRIATQEDTEIYNANTAKRDEAMKLCREKIAMRGLDMKLIDAEYTFDGTKVIFYFTSDGRVDFRELVKDLASVFRMRIELRQIGVRDEAKMVGGIGNCGRCLCCNSWLSDFNPVSIKMAKVQNLSLNPAKISGVCGRLMCCLKYENDIYGELKKGMPDVGERVKTPEGLAQVVDTNILEGKVRVRLVQLEELQPEKGDKERSDRKDKGRKDRKKGDRAEAEAKAKDGGREQKEASEAPRVEEKLSSDIFTYSKEEIERFEKRGRKGQGGKAGRAEESDKEILAEAAESIDASERRELEALLDE